jgi:peptidoglycan lytic transglycosylase G
VTEQAPPPNGSGRAATPAGTTSAGTTPARPTDKPAPATPGGAAPKGQSPAVAKTAKSADSPRPAAATIPVKSGQPTVAPASRPAAMNADKSVKAAAPPRPTNGGGGAAASRPPTPGVRPAIAPNPGRAIPGAGEPYPPLSDRLINGADKNNKHLAPRSPRTALEPDRVDMPTKSRSKKARHPFVIVGNAIITLFILAAIVAGVGLVLGKQRFDAPGPLADDRVVNIPRGSGTQDIASLLVHDGVIDQPWVFVGGVLALKAREDLKAGEYQFKAHASIRDVVQTLVDGRVVAHQLTIPEGLTSEQIVARLLDDDVLTGNIKEIPREGSLLPDTYNFNRGITREQMIQRMQQAQQRMLKEVWDRHSPDLPIKTPEQLIVLASLVEKETGKPEERTRVAAVFVNRLKQKMRLQSDPTIIYGLVGGKGTLGRPIMKSEIDQPTPYNTYQIDGLPPGPIANPGRASLEAAANPARTRELYFVADGTGGHAFAETYEQHQKNVARLRAMEGDQKDAAPADAQPPAPQAAAAPATTPASPRRSPARHNQNNSQNNTQSTH